MKNRLSTLALATFISCSVSTVFAESVLLFDANPATNSDKVMTPDQAISFANKSLVLSCGTPHTAILSSTPDGRGNVLVDNFLTVNGVNVCPAGESCFFGNLGQIAPLNISKFIPDGKQLSTFNLMDWGGQLQSSTLYLVMNNCTILPREIICHNPKISSLKRTVGVTQSVISEHLSHGDSLGVCQ